MTLTTPTRPHPTKDSPAESTLGSQLAPWIRYRERSLLRQMVATVSRPGVRSLAGGLPELDLFPSAEIASALQVALRDDPRALQYSPAQEALKEHVVDLVRRRGVECSVDQVLLTSGAQQGIDIVTRSLLTHGGSVAVDAMTYPGVLQATAPLQPRSLSVRGDLEGGLDVEHLEWLLRSGERPAFLYLIPDAHNPLGVSLAADRRIALAELVQRYRLPILEDDPYGLLCYDGSFAAPVHTLAADRVLYVGSFSKILAPGLRLGYLVGPPDVVRRLSTIKEASDLETSGLTQRAVARLLAEPGWLDAHLERLHEVYRPRRDAMLVALERHFAGRATWSRPRGGMFVWVELEQEVAARSLDTEELLRRCLDERNVAFLPGRAFVATTGEGEAAGRRSMRLSFSSLAPESISEAVEAIADCMKAMESVEEVEEMEVANEMQRESSQKDARKVGRE
ncbi:MAG TPA: PLP-dependent aminotransferase family protein [Thermoanaerobaculia bacterium]|nr:PLP-dependent aminotransferase family protein [Thermoanaerobaculia bacterium]